MSDLHDLAVLYVVDALEPHEWQEFEDHLADCAECQLEVHAMREVTAELSRAVAATPPPSLRAAILGQLAETAQDSAPASAPAHASAPAPAPASASASASASPQAVRTRAGSLSAPTPGSNVTELRARRRSRIPYLVAAAAVLLAVGFGGWGLQARQDADDANRQYAGIAQLLATPDVRTVSGSLPGGGSGTVVLSRTAAQAIFVAEDMPELGGNSVYELWTLSDRPSPAGTFSAQSAPAVVNLPTAALSASRIVITVEPSGGSPQPTTPPIMSIDVPGSV